MRARPIAHMTPIPAALAQNVTGWYLRLSSLPRPTRNCTASDGPSKRTYGHQNDDQSDSGDQDIGHSGSQSVWALSTT